jgi:predicted RNA-binding protein with TRAM domain
VVAEKPNSACCPTTLTADGLKAPVTRVFRKAMPSIEIPDQLLSLSTAALKERNGSYVIEIPNRELHQGNLQRDETYTVALFPAVTSETEPEPTQDAPKPPVQKGDIRKVEIEDIGSQGDGIARIEHGYDVIVPETDVGDRATVEITTARENVAFADVVETENGDGRVQ